jgi:phosphoribosyl 1,2-cyclic phosphodiesterase
MEVCVLASGSKGNSTLIRTENTNIFIDLGPTCLYILEKLKELKVEPSSINAILITHTHSDHTKGLKVFLKKYHPTLFLSEAMLNDLKEELPPFEYVLIDGDFKINDLTVRIIKTSHDASDSNGYIVENKNNSVVYLTDTGFINRKYFNLLKNRSVYIMESNHDVEMLLKGRYPYHLRRRVLSDRGHLSNIDASNYLADFIGKDTKKIILAHLSEENNTKTLALNTLYGVLEEHKINFDNIITADQYEKTELISL